MNSPGLQRVTTSFKSACATYILLGTSSGQQDSPKTYYSFRQLANIQKDTMAKDHNVETSEVQHMDLILQSDFLFVTMGPSCLNKKENHFTN